MNAVKWSQHFSHYKSMGIFLVSQGQQTLRIWPNFNLMRDFMTVLIMCKNEEDPIKN